VFASFALCAPQDFFNPFVPVAVKVSAGGAVLALCLGAFWALERSQRRPPLVIRVASVNAVVSAFACIVVAASAIWLWLQAHNFIWTCAPLHQGSVFEAIKAQRRAAEVADTIDRVAPLAIAFLVVACIVALAVSAALRSSSTRSARTRPA
jgi:hypothetical protein